MQASKLRTYWIMVRTAWTTFRKSSKVIILSYFVKKDFRHVFTENVRDWARLLLKHPQVDYTVVDPYHLQLEPNKQYLIMSNHISHYDIPLVIATMPGDVRMVAKKELFRIPVFSRAMRISEFPSIDRENREQAIKDLAVATQIMQSGIVLWIAPEGTRSRTGQLNPFKKGGFMMALQTGATIIPVGIRGTNKILPPKTLKFQLHQKAELHIGKPIDASQYSLRQRQQLMTDVENSIRGLIEEKGGLIDQK